MRDTIREIFGDEIDEELAQEREEPIVNMLKDNIPASAIASWFNISRDEVVDIARR